MDCPGCRIANGPGSFPGQAQESTEAWVSAIEIRQLVSNKVGQLLDVRAESVAPTEQASSNAVFKLRRNTCMTCPSR